MSSKIRCAAAALAFLLLLSAGAAHARPPGAARIPAVSFENLWQWVVSGWASLWAKEGGEMDPDGLAAPRLSDEGGDMDPNGVRKAGSDMDPDGLVAPRLSDEGSEMDPNG